MPVEHFSGGLLEHFFRQNGGAGGEVIDRCHGVPCVIAPGARLFGCYLGAAATLSTYFWMRGISTFWLICIDSWVTLGMVCSILEPAGLL
jgi:hypothetical protein